MKKLFLSIILLSILITSIYSNEVPVEDQIKTYNDNFITIYLNGYWAKPKAGQYEDAEIFDNIFRVRSEEIPPGKDEEKDYYFHESTEKLYNAGYKNVFAYLFSNGWEKDLFRINGDKPDYMSDVIVREIGDFNYGSQMMKKKISRKDAKNLKTKNFAASRLCVINKTFDNINLLTGGQSDLYERNRHLFF